MEITAFRDKVFGVSPFQNDWQYKFNKDGTLSIWGESKYPVSVMTSSGTFIEAVDESGQVICEGGDGDFFYVPVAKKPTQLRYKALPKIKLSKGQMDKARQVVTRYLVSDRPYALKIPDTLIGAIEWMQKQLAAIPKACRAKASVSFDTSSSYGETYPNVEITFSEPETDEEVIRRLQIETERKRIETNKERAKFEKLKAKFESASP